MQHQHDDALRRRFQELLEARRAGTRPGRDDRRDPSAARPVGRPVPGGGARTFRRKV